MEVPSSCEIVRLPEDLLSAAISRTTPRDAIRAAAVSPAFRAAADSNAVWSCFLPHNLPPLADGELSCPRPSKKELFFRIANHPVVLADGLTSMWLEKETGAKCFMLSARKLGIAWGDTPSHWRWIPIEFSSFPEAADLRHVWWLEIRGKIDSKMLSQNTTYGAYIVYKVASYAYGLGPHPGQNASVSLGGNNTTCRVCLDDGHDSHDEDSPHPLPAGSLPRRRRREGRQRPEIPRDVVLPRERTDDWMELELGEFYSNDGEDGEVCISLMEPSSLKTGLTVQGTEIRAKKQG